jgi:hypothetical protein
MKNPVFMIENWLLLRLRIEIEDSRSEKLVQL